MIYPRVVLGKQKLPSHKFFQRLRHATGHPASDTLKAADYNPEFKNANHST
jgi:hypothetical protein